MEDDRVEEMASAVGWMAAVAEARVEGMSAVTNSVIMEVATVLALIGIPCCRKDDDDLLPASGDGGANAEDVVATRAMVAASAVAVMESLGAMVDINVNVPVPTATGLNDV